MRTKKIKGVAWYIWLSQSYLASLIPTSTKYTPLPSTPSTPPLNSDSKAHKKPIKWSYKSTYKPTNGSQAINPFCCNFRQNEGLKGKKTLCSLLVHFLRRVSPFICPCHGFELPFQQPWEKRERRRKGGREVRKIMGFGLGSCSVLCLKIKGMRATISSSLFLETVGLKPKKNLEISRFKGRS